MLNGPHARARRLGAVGTAVLLMLLGGIATPGASATSAPNVQAAGSNSISDAEYVHLKTPVIRTGRLTIGPRSTQVTVRTSASSALARVTVAGRTKTIRMDKVSRFDMSAGTHATSVPGWSTRVDVAAADSRGRRTSPWTPARVWNADERDAKGPFVWVNGRTTGSNCILVGIGPRDSECTNNYLASLSDGRRVTLMPYHESVVLPGTTVVGTEVLKATASGYALVSGDRHRALVLRIPDGSFTVVTKDTPKKICSFYGTDISLDGRYVTWQVSDSIAGQQLCQPVGPLHVLDRATGEHRTIDLPPVYTSKDHFTSAVIVENGGEPWIWIGSRGYSGWDDIRAYAVTGTPMSTMPEISYPSTNACPDPRECLSSPDGTQAAWQPDPGSVTVWSATGPRTFAAPPGGRLFGWVGNDAVSLGTAVISAKDGSILWQGIGEEMALP